MSTDRPVPNGRRDDGEERAGMERRLTEEDRRRLDDEEGRGRDGDQGRGRDGEEGRGRDGDASRRESEADLDRDRRGDSTRPLRRGEESAGYAAPAATAPAGSTAATASAAGYAASGGRAVVAPGFARGRLHVGINWGAAFFGWIAAMGLAVLLTALLAAVGAAVGVSRGATTVQQASDQLPKDPQTVGLLGIIVLVVIAFVSYYAGGYVAARMSRFDGARQGFAVWLWAVIVALVVAIMAAVAGAKFDVLSTLNTFPRLPVNQGDLTGTGIFALVVLLAITLLGAVIGGAGGMRYHRKLETAEAQFLDDREV